MLVISLYILLDDQRTKISVEYNIGSPPPAGSKKLVLKFLSVNNIVIAPANTGKTY